MLCQARADVFHRHLCVGRCRRKDDAGQWRATTNGFSANFTRATRETAKVVKAGHVVEQCFAARTIAFALGADERFELEQQRFAVERLGEKLPRTSAVCLETLCASNCR